QQYPDLGDDLPYDAAGWTLPYQMNVEVVEGKSPLGPELRAAMKPVRGTPTDPKAPDAPLTTSAAAAGIVPPAGGLSGAGPAAALPPSQNDAFRLINRALAAGGTLRRDGGRWLVSGVDTARLGGWARELGVRAELTNA